MKYSRTLEQACCIIGVIASQQNKEQLTNLRLSDYLQLSPSYTKKITRKLVAGGLITSSQGVGGGFTLAKAPKNVTLLDVVQSIEGATPLFVPTDLLQRVFKRGNAAKVGLTRLEQTFIAAETAATKHLRNLTLYSLMQEMKDGAREQK